MADAGVTFGLLLAALYKWLLIISARTIHKQDETFGNAVVESP
jgi:hypothetical protein